MRHTHGIALLSGVLVSAAPSHAELVASEYFNGYGTSELVSDGTNLNGGTGWTSAWLNADEKFLPAASLASTNTGYDKCYNNANLTSTDTFGTAIDGIGVLLVDRNFNGSVSNDPDNELENGEIIDAIRVGTTFVDVVAPDDPPPPPLPPPVIKASVGFPNILILLARGALRSGRN